MGLFGIDSNSTSNAYDQRQVATDSATVASGLASVVSRAQDNAVQNQHGVILSAPGVINLGGAHVSTGKGGTINISTVPPGFDDVLNNTVKEIVDAGAANTDKTSSLVTDVLKRMTDLSLSAQTGGDSERNKIILWIVLGVLTLLGVVFWRSR